MNVIIFGAGGHGRVVLDILQQADGVTVVGFLDSNVQLHGTSVNGLPVMGDHSLVQQSKVEYNVSGIMVAIGNNKARTSVFEYLLRMGLSVVSAIHPTAIIARSARLGQGVMIGAGAIVGPSAVIGTNVIVNNGVIIEHDNLIEDHANVSSGSALGGSVTIKTGAFLGMGVSVKPGVCVGEWSVIGAGSAVIRDVPDNAVVVGVPAKMVGYREEGTGNPENGAGKRERRARIEP